LRDIRSFILPVPSPSEQHRIVAKVDELMALCDELEQKQTQQKEQKLTLNRASLNALTSAKTPNQFEKTWKLICNNFGLLFDDVENIKNLKQTVLQLAVQGKLVPQDPNDEPASVLLEKITAEKEALIKAGKIKKQKPLPPIDPNEVPFELPGGWEWCRLGNVSTVISGNTFRSEDFIKHDGTRVIKITNAGVGVFIETNDFLPKCFLSKYPSHVVHQGDLILALTRPYISTGLKICRCPPLYDKSLLNQRVAAIQRTHFVLTDYLYSFLRSEFVLNIYKGRFSGSGLQPNLKVKDVTEMLVPICSYIEQQRIVTKVDELMALCDELENKIVGQRQESETLANAMVGGMG
jgi:type I restriction enzyme, S subunit